ncbi:MAG: tRNA (adenosine(37)-N6)-dimethylallyltransferase MiaA, partial [Actinobacteria bacterium]
QALRGTLPPPRVFVRRARSWFRRDPRIPWPGGAADDLVAAALRVIETARG